jgi:hypothetical protein
MPGQHLDGYVATEPRIARSIDFSHPTFAEQALQLIDADAPAYPL